MARTRVTDILVVGPRRSSLESGIWRSARCGGQIPALAPRARVRQPLDYARVRPALVRIRFGWPKRAVVTVIAGIRQQSCGGQISALGK